MACIASWQDPLDPFELMTMVSLQEGFYFTNHWAFPATCCLIIRGRFFCDRNPYRRKQWKRLIKTTSCCFSATVPVDLNYVAIQIYFEPKPFPHCNAMANTTLCYSGCIAVAIANICVGSTIYSVLLYYLSYLILTI